LTFFIEDEFQAHAVRIVLAADEAVILLQLQVAGFVTVDARGHEGILRDSRITRRRALNHSPNAVG
jgi:hypothetical protein